VTLSIISHSEEKTKDIGERLGRLISPQGEESEAPYPFILSLSGILGSGKTTFIKGVARALGIDRVRSPSFIIMNVLLPNVYHIDLYRITTPEEIIPLGILEILEEENSIAFIEWGERLGDLLPNCRIDLNIEMKEKGRLLTFSTQCEKMEKILLELNRCYTDLITSS